MTIRNGKVVLGNGHESYSLDDLPAKGQIVWACTGDTAVRCEHVGNGVCVRNSGTGIDEIIVWHPNKLYRSQEDAILNLLEHHSEFIQKVRTEADSVETSERGFRDTLMGLFLRSKEDQPCGTTSQTGVDGTTPTGATANPKPTT